MKSSTSARRHQWTDLIGSKTKESAKGVKPRKRTSQSTPSPSGFEKVEVRQAHITSTSWRTRTVATAVGVDQHQAAKFDSVAQCRLRPLDLPPRASLHPFWRQAPNDGGQEALGERRESTMLRASVHRHYI